MHDAISLVFLVDGIVLFFYFLQKLTLTNLYEELPTILSWIFWVFQGMNLSNKPSFNEGDLLEHFVNDHLSCLEAMRILFA